MTNGSSSRKNCFTFIFILDFTHSDTPYLEISCDVPVLVPMSVANVLARTKSENSEEERYNRCTAARTCDKSDQHIMCGPIFFLSNHPASDLSFISGVT